ncbi:MAG: DUF4435 domain-containing protein [Elstera sp.]
MALSEKIEIPTFHGSISIEANAATSIVLVGANGSGKTRLGVFLDQHFSRLNIEVHRIAAHRSLNLNPNIIPPNLDVAMKRLHYGNQDSSPYNKNIYRYKENPATVLLDDFDHLLSALYAENNDVSIAFRQQCLSNPGSDNHVPNAKIDTLKLIWEKVLPHRELIVMGGNIKTKTKEGTEYSPSAMSEGERVIFYLIAQALLARTNSLLIFDEPELHINKSILANLWDEIESTRPDCAFLYITHDIEFVGSRHAATKYVLRKYRKEPSEAWDIELIPEEAGIPEDVVVTILGSRRPILFVEGNGSSLDFSIYRRVYRDFTVIPVGPCEQVIHTVTSFAARSQLHRFGCAGLIDADGRTKEEVAHLETKGIYCLPVSEVENLLLLPNVFAQLAKALSFSDQERETRFTTLRAFVLDQAGQEIDAICLRHTKRRIDANMKKIGLLSMDIISLSTEFRTATASIDANTIFTETKTILTNAINAGEYETILYYYDNKGLLAEAAKRLEYQRKNLEEFVGRILRSDNSSQLNAVLSTYLPKIINCP